MSQFHKQKLPSSVTEDDILKFDMEREYREVRRIAPLLTHTIAGSLNLKAGDLQVTPANNSIKWISSRTESILFFPVLL